RPSSALAVARSPCPTWSGAVYPCSRRSPPRRPAACPSRWRGQPASFSPAGQPPGCRPGAWATSICRRCSALRPPVYSLPAMGRAWPTGCRNACSSDCLPCCWCRSASCSCSDHGRPMVTYPQIDPVALSLGPLQIHWYGLMSLIGIGGAWWLASRRLKRFEPTWTSETLSDLVFWVALGVIAGGRLGYVLFYDLGSYISDPTLILQIWKGGMSFHGGLLGVL